MPTRQRAVLLALAVAVAVAAIVVIPSLDGGGDATRTSPAKRPATVRTTTAAQTPASATPTIVVRDAKPVGGVQALSYDSGDEVEFVVKSDTADEIHVHGYDLTKEVRAGGTARFRFRADAEGIFEIELERHHEQIGALRVSP